MAMKTQLPVAGNGRHTPTTALLRFTVPIVNAVLLTDIAEGMQLPCRLCAYFLDRGLAAKNQASKHVAAKIWSGRPCKLYNDELSPLALVHSSNEAKLPIDCAGATIPRCFAHLHRASPPNHRSMPGLSFCRRLTLIYFVCTCLPGCRSIEKKAPTQEAVATGRQLARQGISALDAGRCQEGETLLQQAVAAVPSDPEAHRYLAEALWQRGAASEAIQHIESAQVLSPSDPAVIVRAGEMLLATGDHARALQAGNRAIELDPKLSDAWALRGRVWWLKKQPDSALADLQRALKFSPSAPDLLIDVANIYYQQGQPQRCLTTVHRLLDIHAAGEEPLEAIVLEGKAYLAMGLPIPAGERFALVKSRSAPSPDLCCLIAQAECAAGRPEAAIVAAQEAVTLDASHRPSRELLAKLTSGAPAATIR